MNPEIKLTRPLIVAHQSRDGGGRAKTNLNVHVVVKAFFLSEMEAVRPKRKGKTRKKKTESMFKKFVCDKLVSFILILILRNCRRRRGAGK